jgi:predicted transcriptional regulator
MSTAELKELRKEVKDYIDHADERMVRMMYAMLETDAEADWYDELPDEIKASLEDSMKQADAGQVITHDQMRKKYPQWFTK